MKRGFFNKREENNDSPSTNTAAETIEALRKQLTEYLHVQNDMEKAEKLCTDILAIDPYLPEYLLKRALIRENLGKDADALKDAALYQHMYPFNLEALSLQARLLEKTGSHTAALRVLRLLMAFDKDELLREEYDKVESLTKKPKKKRKRSKQGSSRHLHPQQAPSKGPIKVTYEATLDESGVIILEEEKGTIKGKKGAAPSGPISETLPVENYLAEDLETALKVNPCSRCALLADYTQICSHYEMFSEKDVRDLSQIQDRTKSESTYQSKQESLKNISRTLEILSSKRETGICILSAQFSAVLLPYINGSLEKIFPNSGWACQHCVGTVSPLTHAILVVCRSIKYLLDIHTQYLVKGEKTFVYEIDETTLAASIDCFAQYAKKLNMSIIRCQFEEYLRQEVEVRRMAMLMRLFANLVPLNISSYTQMISGIMIKFLENLFEAILKINYAPYLSQKWFQLLILHSFRLLLNLTEWIGLQSIRKEFTLCMIVDFVDAFAPISSRIPTLPLILSELKRSLTTRIEGGLHLHHKNCKVGEYVEKSLSSVNDNAYELGKYGAGLKELYNLNCCANCHKGNIMNLKLCSKCKKILYCGKECQKAHYPIHKSECKSS